MFNPSITHENIKDNYDLPWNYNELSIFLHNITLEFFEKTIDKKWGCFYLSRNEYLQFEIVLAHPEKPWDYDALSSNSIVTWDIVQENPNIPWDYDRMSYNPNITWKIVEENSTKSWDYGNLSSNNMTKHLYYIGNHTDYVLK